MIEGYINEDVFNGLYNLCYISMVFIALLSVVKIDARQPMLPKKYFQYIVYFFSICFVLLVGLRNYDVGVDTRVYYWQWDLNIFENIFEVIFYSLMQFTKYLNLSFTAFLIIVAIIYYYFFSKGVKNLAFHYQANFLLIFLSLFSLFFMLSMSINIMRQGVALAFVFYFFSLWLLGVKGRKKYLYLVLAFLSHTTSVIPVILFFAIQYIGKKIPIYFFTAIYFLGVVLAFLNVGLLSVMPIISVVLGGDSHRMSYITTVSQFYTVGFKPQFVAFNTVFLLLGLYVRNQKYMIENSWQEKYTLVLKYFMISSFIFFMAFQIPYSDRWGLFSWIVIPILTAPLFSEVKKGIKYKTLVVLFFIFIYAFFEMYRILKQNI